MKLKNIFKYLIIAFLAIQLGACTNTDAEQKFDETPTERLNGQKNELNTALLSSEFGWKAIYYTDDSQLGGFTHLFKFLPNGKVDMASDFDDDAKKYISQYEIQLGSTVSLTFTTQNRIHLLSDSDNSPLAGGKGFLGDFQFLYYGQENGDILFKSNRLVKEIRFVKATAQDWADLAKNTIMNNNLAGNVSSSLFRLLETNDGTTIKKYDFNYNSVTRFGTAEILNSDNYEALKMAVAFTPTGLIIKPAIVVGGQNLVDFTYDNTSNAFIGTGTNGVKATIKFTDSPPRPTDDYKVLLDGNPQITLAYLDANLYSAASTSPYCKSLIDKVNASLPANQKLTRINLVFNNAVDGTYIQYQFTRGSIFHFVLASEDVVNKAIILTDDGWSVNAATRAFLKDLDAEFTKPKGLYIKKETFTIFYNNTVYTLTSASSPFRITAYRL